MKQEIEESRKIMKDWFKQYYEKPEKVTSFMLDQEDRIKELEQINEEHRKINGELRKTINEAVNILERIYLLENVSITNNAVNEIDKAINILQGSDE